MRSGRITAPFSSQFIHFSAFQERIQSQEQNDQRWLLHCVAEDHFEAVAWNDSPASEVKCPVGPRQKQP